MTGKFLLSILFCLLSIPAWAQVTGTAPELRFIESDQAAALGRWRMEAIRIDGSLLMKTFWKSCSFALFLLIALGIWGVLVRGQEKSAPVAISQESQQALQSLQKDYDLAAARLEAAQNKVELVRAQFLLLRRAIQDAAPTGYVLDEGKMQYTLKPKEPEKK